jgi:MSHA biogenesis protein MshQ
VQDSDGVEIESLDLDVDADTTLDHTQATDAAALRYGRLRLDNAHGSEVLTLPMLMHAEYWTGSAFSWNVADSCTPFTPAALALSNDIESGVNPIKVKDSVTTTATITNNPTSSALSSGDGNLQFSAPGSGGDGWVDVQLTVPPYLQFDWHGAGDVNPTSRATFGIYQGNEHIIYIRETTWR